MRAVFIATILFAGIATAQAQPYPSKPIRMVVGFAPGGGTDVTARTVVQGLSDALGQRVVVDNRPGANGTIGAEIVAKSPADGYTILMVNNGHTVNPGMYSNLPYNTIRDFAPVTLVAMLPNILVTHPSLPPKTFPEFVRFSQTRPGAVHYGSGGHGASSHLAMELLKQVAKIDIVHVPYKSGGQSTVAILTGDVAASFNTIPSAVPHVKAGRLRALGVSSLQRTAGMPDVPTIAEMGYPGFSASGLAGLVVPAGTPVEAIERLHDAVKKTIALPVLQERFVTLGMDAVGNTPTEFGRFIKSDMDKWVRLTKELKLSAQ
ncbi:MAG: tripartite tricarboxylate transporter substrate binding protein [Burkholderiales bacterium]|nr:tripartite tricarboxylate transporter substrate binding protein [Burkholderiales bacterium]